MAKKQITSKVKKAATPKQVLAGRVYVTATFNNTLVTLTDASGNTLAWGSSGGSGFKGARKSTPYAANLVGKDALEKARGLGLQEAKVSIRGIGPGRESAIRGVASTGVNIISIVDSTPMAHNGVRPTKPRRV